MNSTPASFRALRVPRLAVRLAALSAAAAGLTFQPAAQAANGAPYYFDVNGTAPGFYTSLPSGSSYNLSDNSWSTDATGASATGALASGGQITFGASSGDFSGATFTMNLNRDGAINGWVINSTNANMTFIGSANNPLATPNSWTVAAGSTLTMASTYDTGTGKAPGGLNFNGQITTLAGGGTINFTTRLGLNSSGRITENDAGAGLTVNLSAPNGGDPFAGGFTLTSGRLNFANAAAASALGGGQFIINGGVIGNTSGSAMTLAASVTGNTGGASGIAITNSFVFAGSSDLNLGNQAVALGTSPTIAVNANTLTLGGVISGSGFGLTKTGGGTLTLTGINSFSGPTQVNQGTLRIATPSALALPTGLKIMPLGDSITLGDGSSAGSGYRYPLYARLNPIAPAFQFVGASSVSAGALPATPLDERFHNGRESYSCNDLNNNLDGLDSATFLLYGGAGRDPNGGYWLTGGNGTGRDPVYPDAILLLVGANDINRVGMSGVQTRIEALLTKITALRPATRVFLARITPYLSYPADVTTFNGLIDTVGANFQAAGKKITVVDLNTNFPADGLSGDGVHPSDSGYSWMADRWYDALVSVYGSYPPAGSSLALAASSAVTVAAGARLEGTGQIAGPLSVAGTLAPGTGTLAAGATTLTGTYACDLGSTSSAQLAVTGDLNLTNATLALNALAAPGIASYVIASYTGTLHGAFTSVTGLPGGFALQYDASGKQILLATTATGAVKLAITQVNGGAPPAAGTAFSVVVQAQNLASVATPVAADTAVTLSLKTGTGTLAGTLSRTIPAGQSQVTVTAITYSKAEGGVVLAATRSSGDNLFAANSASFTVNPGAVSATASTVAASPASATANGITSSTISVTLMDGSGNPVPGKTVTLVRNGNAGTGTPSITPVTATTSAAGVGTFAVVCTTAGAYDFQATGDGVPIAQKATVTFSVALSSPGSVSNGLTVWLKADAIGTADATQVQTSGGSLYVQKWNDQSGSSQHASQGTLANQPQYLANNLNGLPTVKWDGTGRFLRGPANLTGQTIFAVCKVDADASGLDGMFCQSPSADSKNIRGSATQWNADAWQADGNDFAHGGQIFVNGTSGYTHNGNWHVLMEVSASAPSFIYQLGQTAYNRYFNGRIAEFIIYNRTLTSDEMNAVGGYLAAKYALTTAYPPPVQPSAFDTWANGTFANGALSDKTAGGDPDHDGLTNQQEFAFGLDPTTGASANPVTRQLDRATGVFKYTRRTASGLSYVYQSSTTLGDPWVVFTPVAAVSNNVTPVEEITVTVPPSLLTNPKLFVRVKAQ